MIWGKGRGAHLPPGGKVCMLSLQMCGMSVMDKRGHPRVIPAATPLLL